MGELISHGSTASNQTRSIVFYESLENNSVFSLHANDNIVFKCIARSKKYINSLVKAYEHSQHTINIIDVKTIALEILTEFINDDSCIEEVCVKLVSLAHFLKQESFRNQSQYNQFINCFIASIIFSCDIICNLTFVDAYFGQTIQQNLAIKCSYIKKEELRTIYNKNYVLIFAELQKYFIDGIRIIIMEFVEFPYFNFLLKMDVLFAQCIGWKQLVKIRNFNRRQFRPKLGLVSLPDLVGISSRHYSKRYVSLYFEIEIINAHTFLFLHRYKYIVPSFPVTAGVYDTYTLFGIRYFMQKISVYAAIIRFPKRFLRLVSYFAHDDSAIIHEILVFLFSMDSEWIFLLFVDYRKRIWDYIFNSILIKYGITNVVDCAFGLIYTFITNLFDLNSQLLPENHEADNGLFCNKIFVKIYPEYITDQVIDLAKKYPQFEMYRSYLTQRCSAILRLPGFSGRYHFISFMQRMTLLSHNV